MRGADAQIGENHRCEKEGGSETNNSYFKSKECIHGVLEHDFALSFRKQKCIAIHGGYDRPISDRHGTTDACLSAASARLGVCVTFSCRTSIASCHARAIANTERKEITW